ncbi:hypothetical protein PMZ80_003966 [Knufia obscura]|uniref:Protein kinase domain-containing protein n=1 Tax=Knufia obscura TaxID=1635080 RepID=A0ABR0RQT5_9EURO|nr:hypothetical protein PMZ80_003966 [Knufia obscura]
MSNSLGSNEARANWSTLLAELHAELEKAYPTDNIISDEDEFRQAFEELSEELHQNPADKNYAFFARYHVQILFFVEVVDKAVGLKSPNTLNDVFWTTAFTAVKVSHSAVCLVAAINTGQVAFERKFLFPEFQNVYPDINEKLPLFSSDLSQFPRNVRIQEPLLQIFEMYIRCYIALINQLNTRDDGIDFHPVYEHINMATELYQKAEVDWRTRFGEALQEQKSMVLHGDVGGSEDTDTRFEKLRPLGKGAYGAVDEVRETTTGSVYARKSIPINIVGSDPDTIRSRVENEVEIMSKLRHNHIASINLYFKGEQYWSMIMLPVADCDLRTFLDEKCVKAGFPRKEMRLLDPWFGCLVSALSYAHTEMVKHEDIKPSNILIKDRKIYLTDFGTAKDFSELEASTVSDFPEQGTPVYWAPEPRAWGRPADVFALGCVFSEMITVRQKRTLPEYRKFRFNPSQEFGYAYRSNLLKVRRWLTRELDGISSKDPVGQLIVEQTLNMLTEDSSQRSEARRVKHQLRAEEALFCATCF